MQIQIPKQLFEIIDKFRKSGFEIYIVGGAVRDLLMEKETYDWDLTTNATPEEMLNIFPVAFYDNAYGTVGVENEIEGNRPYEITTYRTEFGYSDTRRPDKVEWGKTLDEDLKRRDFTINAMCLDVQTADATQKTEDTFIVSAVLIDLFNGKDDIDKKLIRTVGNSNERFSEDALRMMRAVRLASELGFTIEKETFEGIKKNSTLINKITKERVRDELLKIFKSSYPYEGMVLFRNCGLMALILPEMEATFGVEQKSPGRHHIYDVGTHSLMSLKNCPSKDPIVRFATFIHDSGKVKTFKKSETGLITFYNHELVSTNNAYRIAKRLRFSNKDTDTLIKLVRWHQFTVDERQTDSAIRRFINHVGLDNLTNMLDLRVGDRLGGGATETSWRLEEFKQRLLEVQKQPFSVRDLKIDGNDVMKILGLNPGPEVGEILNELFNKVVEKKVENKKEELTIELKKLLADGLLTTAKKTGQ